ncbi:hypothetical protein ACFFRR_006024 [Megaselia abdita]
MLAKTLTILAIIYLVTGTKDQFHNFDSFYDTGIKPRFSIEDLGATNLGPEEEKGSTFWINKAQESLREKVTNKPLIKRAKNVIFFIGDGLSIATMTAARIYDSQGKGNPWGEENILSFEKLPYSGQVKTYCTNAQVADSACTATAYHTGVKTSLGSIGVNANVSFFDCAASSDSVNQVDSILKLAQDSCKSTGIVTTTKVTHASPAPLYAHSAFRDWEADTDIEKFGIDPSTCQDIASQLVNNSPGNKINVVLGGGRGRFLPKELNDENGVPGLRGDGQDLISKWKADHPQGRYVSNKVDLLNAQKENGVTDLLGLFQLSHMDYYDNSNKDTQPSLTDMTEAAIELLSKNSNGFYLFVEGGHIDSAHHDNKLRHSLRETTQFARAIERTLELINLEETLVVVSSDHSHTVGIAGYPKRGNDIVGLADPTRDSKNLPYTSMNYMFGPKQYRDENGERIDLTNTFASPDMNLIYPSMTPATDNYHAGDDVAIFAAGPYAHLFTGVLNQNVIPEMMSFAACLGNDLTHCKLFNIPSDTCEISSTKCDSSVDLDWRAVRGVCTDFKVCAGNTWLQLSCPNGLMFKESIGFCVRDAALCPESLLI